MSLPAPTVPSGGFRDGWAGQVGQYPRSGPPGIAYFLGIVGIGDFTENGRRIGRVRYEVDHLLHRSRKGELTGILQFFPEDAPLELERAGNFNVWVHPRRLRRGIGLALLTEADRRWGPLNLHQQSYTPEGLALAEAFQRRRGA